MCPLPGGGTCPPGARCPHPDGCNTCTCGPNQSLSCTEIGCAVDAGSAPDAPTQDVPLPRTDVAVDVTPTTDAGRQCERSSECAAGERCVFSPTSGCGESDFGVCRAVPGCESLPVAPQYCGCDGRTFTIPNACPPDRPFVSVGACAPRGAVMLWQAPGGFAGTGPAIRVQDDGTVWTWRSVTELSLDGPTPMPDGQISLPASRVSELFAHWTRLDLSRLPHGPMTSNDCYPSVRVRRCRACAEELLRYQGPAQLTPEMNAVWGWFAMNPSLPQPRSFCEL